MSIFAKDCPRCGETNAAYAVRCRCGFEFNSVGHAEEDESDVSVTLQEEELYLEYLRARAQQAADSAKRAVSAAAGQPANKAAAAQSQQAQAAAEQAMAELEQQRARMKVAMHALGDDHADRQAHTASASQPSYAARDQSPAPSVSAAPAPAKPAPTPPVVERKEPAPAAAKPAAPAAKSSEPSPPAAAKASQDLNKYIPTSDKSKAASTVHTFEQVQVKGNPAHTQARTPTAVVVSSETKPHGSAAAAVSKAASPTATTNAAHAVPIKTENAPANKQPSVGSASTTARSVQPAHKDTGAAPQATRVAEVPDKPIEQDDAVAAKAAAVAARAKQLAQALKAAQAERAAKNKVSAAMAGASAADNSDSKTGQAKPTASSARTPPAKISPAPSQASSTAGATSVPGAPSASSVNGQQHRLNAHDKPTVDINAIHIPGTEPGDSKPEHVGAAPKQTDTAPATAVKGQHAASTPVATDSPAQKVNGTARPMAGDKATASPTKPASGVTVTVTSGANPQDELEAALKALSPRAPTPAPAPDKMAADASAAAGLEIGTDPAPTAALTPPSQAPEELPSLEPVMPANQKDCPNCTALLPMETKRCRCGFSFPEIEETMPGLSLSDSDFAALDGDAPSDGITHLG